MKEILHIEALKNQNVERLNFVGDWSFQDGIAQPADGAALIMKLDNQYQALSIEFEILDETGDGLTGKLGSYLWLIAGSRGGLTGIKGNMNPEIVFDTAPLLPSKQWTKVKVMYSPEIVTLKVGELPPLVGRDPRGSCRYVTDAVLHGRSGISFCNVTISGIEKAPDNFNLPSRKSVSLSMTIDFPDDLFVQTRPWQEEDLRSLIRTYADAGIDRVYWMDYGAVDVGIWLQFDNFFHRKDVFKEFFSRIPNPLAIVTDEAHKQGMSVFSIIKPFDFGNNWRHLPDDPAQLPESEQSLWNCGGYIVKMSKFMKDHPELLT